MKEIEKQITGTIVRHADELLNENWASIAEMLKEVPDGKINVGLSVAIDWSEAAPKVKTIISYSRKWKDEREDELDDPNQVRLKLETGEMPLTGEPTEAGIHEPGEPEQPPTDNDQPAKKSRSKRVREAKVS